MTQPNPLKTQIFDPFPTQPNPTQPAGQPDSRTTLNYTRRKWALYIWATLDQRLTSLSDLVYNISVYAAVNFFNTRAKT